jgi:hypothetical protein
MEQRPLRLGDIVDDYCPRERRITNHAIVVMTGADIHLTRCTACESEHPYKHAKLPLRRPAEPLENGNGHLVKPAPPPEAVTTVQAPEPAPPIESLETVPASEPAAEAPPAETYHRPLIRAALPKGIVPAAPRPLPDFTMRNIRNRDGRDGRSNGRRFSR